MGKFNYFDWKNGLCSDVEYFRSAYGGSVTKNFSSLDTLKNHPFFLIKRRLTEDGETFLEFKVYDLKRGLIYKKKCYILSMTNKEYWDLFTEKQVYKDYVQYLCDSYDIIPPEPEKPAKKTKK